MNRVLVDKLARALLYEGYILYPYRPSVKNRQRWTFGGIYPQAWSDAQKGTDAWTMQTQCLVAVGSGEPPGQRAMGYSAILQVAIRFLHLMDRTIGEISPPLAQWPADKEPAFVTVPSLEIAGKRHEAWQEAVEREVDLGEFDLASLLAQPQRRTFIFPHQRALEPLRSPAGEVVGVLVREQQAIEGEVELTANAVAEGLLRVGVKILNHTPLSNATEAAGAGMGRDDALMRSLVSTHTILGLRGGEFVSLTDPPEAWKTHAAGCRNIGAWPVLVGSGTERDTMLSSPIILYDYPQLAPESPGDLFDATEIDEILTLRILTLTDEEKRTAASVDERVRDLLARTESLAREQLMGLHGTIRGLRPVSQSEHGEHSDEVADFAEVMEAAANHSAATIPSPTPASPTPSSPTPPPSMPMSGGMEDWDPFRAESSGPDDQRRLDHVTASGVELRAGDQVRLRPLGRADIIDIALDGMTATIVAIEQDYENRIHLAVTVDDDPGKDFGRDGKPGHRFFFGIDEVEPVKTS